MNCLSLYVEKWYIVGAINTGNGLQRIVLPNSEDRIWLYFFEDVANDRIYYGKSNKKNAQNKEAHYYQDVFGSIVDSNAKFKKFGRDFPLAEIFKWSGIFDDLQNAYKQWASDETIPTFISFSQDISYNAQSIFIEQLEKNGFVIKQFAGKVEFLAVEWLNRTNKLHLPTDKKVLVLKSTNENLHMSLFGTDGKIFTSASKDILEGYGNDVRSHAVIEDVIKQGNATLKFLTKKEEFEHEMKRMEDMVEDWILRLDAGKRGIPVKIPNINFSLAPENKFTANLRSANIDERTKAIIRTIVDYVKGFVTDKAGIHSYDLGAVILLGNSFENSQYYKEIDQWLQINEANMFKINEAKLSDVVNVYSQIPEDYFSAEEKFFGSQSEAEKVLQAQNEQERREREIEERKLADQRRTEEEKNQAAKAYKGAMDQYYEAASRKDFANMREFLTIALEKKPGDDAATKLLAQLEDDMRKADIESKQYKNAINTADQLFEQGDIDGAIGFYTQALTIDASSSHARERLKELSSRKEHAKKAQDSITRADVFESQKLYDKALTELKKAKLLDPDNQEIDSKIQSIESIINAAAEKINGLKKTLDACESKGDYVGAIVACEQLILEDDATKSKWEIKLEKLKATKQNKEEEERIVSECKRVITSETFKDNCDWETVLAHAKKALSYVPDDDFFTKSYEKALREIDRESKPKEEPKKPKTTPPVSSKPKTTSDDWDFGNKKKDQKTSKPSGGDFFDSDSKKPAQKPATNKVNKKDDGWDF